MSYIFGPVPSRRLGYSLGVDLVPAGCKTCTLDCVYCQVGRTKDKRIKRGEFVPTSEVLAEVDAKLPMDDVHFVTFSGTGEPTLHRDLGLIIDRIRKRCSTPVAVLTNSTLIDQDKVRRDLAKADLVVPSLDAVTPEIFERVNRPHPAVSVEKIIDGLIQFRKEFSGQLWVEVMLVKGFNDRPDELLKIKQAIDRINPDRIHINTVTRPPAEKEARPLQINELERIASLFGPLATAIGVSPKKGRRDEVIHLEQEVLDLVRRRGVTLHDLTVSLGLHKDVAADVLEKLVKSQKIKKAMHRGVAYYREYY